MSSPLISRLTLLAGLVLGLAPAQAGSPVPQPAQIPAMLGPWVGPYGGVPAWSQVRPDQFPAAFAVAMQAQREAIQRITGNPEAPSFANTILALEQSGAALDRVSTLFSVHAGTLNLGVIPKVEQEMAPKLAAFYEIGRAHV